MGKNQITSTENGEINNIILYTYCRIQSYKFFKTTDLNGVIFDYLMDEIDITKYDDLLNRDDFL